MKCSVDGCCSSVTCKGFCNVHYQRWHRTGSTERKMVNWHGGRYRHEQGYIRVHIGNNEYRMEHVLKAEKALGKPLPADAVVHHMNGDPGDNETPWNLVVCPDQDYHLLLHRRAQALGYEPIGGFKLAKKPSRKPVRGGDLMTTEEAEDGA